MRPIEKKLDIAFSRWIRDRDGWRCVLCGSTSSPECGHLLPRFSRATRWDARNAACLCRWCNAANEEDPAPYVNWWKETHGQEAYDDLVATHNKPRHFFVSELEEMLKGFM